METNISTWLSFFIPATSASFNYSFAVRVLIKVTHTHTVIYWLK